MLPLTHDTVNLVKHAAYRREDILDESRKTLDVARANLFKTIATDEYPTVVAGAAAVYRHAVQADEAARRWADIVSEVYNYRHVGADETLLRAMYLLETLQNLLDIAPFLVHTGQCQCSECRVKDLDAPPHGAHVITTPKDAGSPF